MALSLTQRVLCVVFPGKYARLDGEATGEAANSRVLLSHFGSMQMELYLLSKRAGIPEMGDLADYPIRYLDQTYKDMVRVVPGLPQCFLAGIRMGLLD